MIFESRDGSGGQGALLTAAKTDLLPAWESGTSAEVADAMAKFREANERGILEQGNVDNKDPAAVRVWAAGVERARRLRVRM